jgi:hypothetical protein
LICTFFLVQDRFISSPKFRCPSFYKPFNLYCWLYHRHHSMSEPKDNAILMSPLWEQRGLWWSHFSELDDAKLCPEIQNMQRLFEINMTKNHITMRYFMHFLAPGTKENTEQKELNWNTAYGWQKWYNENTHQKFISYCLETGKLMRNLSCHVFLHSLHIHLLTKFNWDSVVGIAIKLLEQYVFFSPKCPHRLWGLPTLLFSGNQGAFPELRRPGHEAKHTYTYYWR